MKQYKIEIPINDFSYYLMDIQRRKKQTYKASDVKNAMKKENSDNRLELGKILLPELLATEKCWTDTDKEYILSNYTQEDVYDNKDKLLGIRYKYMARFLEAFEDLLEDVEEKEENSNSTD